jgi:hypothetical protein
MDGELLDVKIGTDQAAPFGSTQQVERKQHKAPGTWVEMVRGNFSYDRASSKVRESPVTGELNTTIPQRNGRFTPAVSRVERPGNVAPFGAGSASAKGVELRA